MAKRYEQMIALVAQLKPRTIIEVGVHGAKRAVALCTEALKYGPVQYWGFDVFDTLGSEFQKEALNGKGIATEAKARKALDRLSVNPEFSYELIIGDTRQTLHGITFSPHFAFIDGDHRVDAIRGDYLALQDSQCVVFDDYYRAGPDRRLPDLSKYGANAVVDSIDDKRVEILPVGDLCNHGAVSFLAVVR